MAGKKDESEVPNAAAARARTPREKWLRRALRWGVLPLTLYTLIGFFGVPALIKHLGIPQLNKRIDGKASLERARVNPFKLSLRLENLAVADSAGTQIAGLKSFDGRFILWDTIFQSGWHFEKAIVESPMVRAELSKEGELNFEKLMRPLLSKSSEPLKRIPRLVVHKMSVAGADIGFRDNTTPTPFETAWPDLNFQLDELDTRPDNENPHVLRAVSSSGESLEWSGTFLVNPLTSKGKITIGALDLPRFMPYLEGKTDGTVVSGKLTAEVEYEFAPLGTPRVLQAKVVKGSVSDLRVDLEGRQVVAAKLAGVSGAALDADKRTLAIEGLTVSGGFLAAERDAAGLITLSKLAPRVAAGAASAAGERIDPRSIPYPVQQVASAVQQIAQDVVGPWDIALEKLAIDSTVLAVSDLGAVRPVVYEFRQITLGAGPVRTSERYALPFNVALDVREGGRVEASGVLRPFDRKAEIKARTEALNIAPVGGYFPESLSESVPPAVLASGLVTVSGDLSVDLSNEAAGGVKWTGDVLLASARLDAPAGAAEVASVGSATLKGAAELAVENLKAKGLRWEGRIDVADAKLATPIGSVERVAAAKLEAEGKASAELNTGSSTLSWQGKAGLGGLDAAGKVPGPVSIKVAQATSDGSLGLTTTAGAEPALKFTGAAEASGVSAAAPELFKSTVSLGKGVVSGVELDTSGRTVSLASVVAEEPALAATFPILPPPGEGKAAKKSGEKSSEKSGGFVNPVQKLVQQVGWGGKVDSLKVSGGQIRVTDDSPQSPAELVVESIEVEGSGLSTDGQTIADLSISSKVQSSGNFKLAGKVDAFRAEPVADVQVSVSGVPAKPFDPFVGRYVGYLVERGRVNSTIPIKIQDGKLTGSLDFALDQFHLGEGTGSKDAPDVPIKLGLDLLRDGNDRVSGKIPLSGNLSDPGFSVIGLVWEAFFNLIFKAATAPFQILGSLFGAAEGQDLSMVPFEPGASAVAADALPTLDILAKAMKERPAITMVADGRYNVEADTPGMRRVILREQMLKRVQLGTPYIEKLDDKLYRGAVEAAWKEVQRAQAGDAPPPEREGGAPTFEAMEKDLLEKTEVPVDRFAELARARAEAVVAVLVKDNGISPERVTVGKAEGEKLVADKPKVEFGVK